MTNIREITSVAYLKALGRKPRVHPNGFIQFDVVPGALRINVRPERMLPGHPGRVHPIHNHSFDLHSVILVGALTNITYELRTQPPYTQSDPTHVLHVARRISEHDSVLQPIHSARGQIRVTGMKTYHPGQDYALPRNVLHDSLPHGLTMTLMWTENPDALYAPQIAVPVGVMPMNNYKRDAFDENLLWDIIALALEKYEHQRRSDQTSI